MDDNYPMVSCPKCKTGRLSDDGHDGNIIVRSPDGRLGIFYKEFFEGNWSPTPPGCYSCGAFFTLPDLVQVNFGARQWVNHIGHKAEDESLKTPTGGYYTRRSFVVDSEAKA